MKPAPFIACPYCLGERFLTIEEVHSDELCANLKSPGFAVRKTLEATFDLRACVGCGHIAWFVRNLDSLRDERFIVSEASVPAMAPYR